VNLLQFSWNKCSAESYPINVRSLQIAPDPLLIPGNLNLGFDFDSNVNITSPTPLSVKIQKHMGFFWYTIPCEDDVGSCEYKDFCAKWPFFERCPNAFKKYDIPCNCPISAGSYHLPLSFITKLDKGPIPKWMEDGKYKIKIVLSNPEGEQLLCLAINLKLASN
ncbi:ganglioside GM2 activator-like protein, partial [Dinothrombium tinctorium]